MHVRPSLAKLSSGRNYLQSAIPDLVAVAVLAILPLLVFWAVWAPNHQDRVIFGGDILMGGYATRVFVHRLLNLGEVPLWNPYQLGGMPLLADVQVAVYYLPNLLLDFVYWGRDLTYLGYEMLVIGHYMLGAVFFYAYLRNLGIAAAAALLGAIAFEFNGFFVGHRGHVNMLAVVVWVPGVLWLLDKSWRSRQMWHTLVWAVLASFALSQMVMAGHPQVIFYSTLFIIAYFVYRWIGSLKSETGSGSRNLRGMLRIPVIFSLVAAIAGGISAISLLPTAELLGQSLRSEPNYDFAVAYSLLPRNFINLLIPEFLGWSGTELRIYAGVLTLVLTVVAWTVPDRSRSERTFFTVTLIVALLISLGGFTTFYGVLYRFVPGFGAVRVSARAFYFANFALAVLAAFGADSLLRQLSSAEAARLRKVIKGWLWFLVVAGLIAAVFYLLLGLNYRSVGEEFYTEQTFQGGLEGDSYTLLTQTLNNYLLFLLLLLASIVLLWVRAQSLVTSRRFIWAAVVLIALDVSMFAPYHDTIRVDLEKRAFTVRNYGTTFLDQYQTSDQQEIVALLRTLPDGVRVDNSAEVLPDNYSHVWQIPFDSGYNVLDLQARFKLRTEWPYLGGERENDLLNVGYILTLPDNPEPPEEDAELLLENSQGKVWRRAQQPPYAYFSTQARPAATMITVNGLLNVSDQIYREHPTIARPELSDESSGDMPSSPQSLRRAISEVWPQVVDPSLYQIGTTGVTSPVNISVLAGGSIKYSAVIVDGETVTPQQRGIVLAVIDPNSGQTLTSGGFDTYQSELESRRLAAAIQAAPQGAIVALATYDEGTARLTPDAYAALASLGAVETLQDRLGYAYALIGIKGGAPGTAMEQLSPESTVLDVGVAAAPPTQNATFNSQIVTYRPNQITLLVENSAQGLLTISEPIYPGWEAFVDGAPTPILRANGLFRSIVLPPNPEGRPHEVTFIFQPFSVRLSSAISVFTAVLAVGLLVAAMVFGLISRRRLPHIAKRYPDTADPREPSRSGIGQSTA